MSKKTLIVIAAIAVMLAGAASAYGYYEGWDGWFSSGTLTYNDTAYTVVWSGLECDDSTYTRFPLPDRDTFGIWPEIPAVAFKCVSADDDTIFVQIDSLTGGKEFGTSGTKEGEGYWGGDGFRYNEEHELVEIFDFWGTWDTDDGNDYFNYNSEPDPTYTADWDVTGSDPDGITGSGACSGQQTYYNE